MKVTVTQANLRRIISEANTIVPPLKSGIPVLQMIKLSFVSYRLYAEATNLQTTVVANCPADVESNEDSVVLVPAELMKDIVQNLPDNGDAVTLEYRRVKKKLEVACGKYRSSIKITEEAEIFPVALSANRYDLKILIDAKSLSTALSCLAPFTVDDHVHPERNGFLFETGDDKVLRVVATDGNKIAVAELAHNSSTMPIRPVVPADVLKCLKILESVESVQCCFSSEVTEFIAVDTVISCKTIAQAFPKWQMVIPSEFVYNGAVEKADLLAMIERLHALLDAGQRIAIMQWKNNRNQIQVTAQADGVEFAESLACFSYAAAKPFVVKFDFELIARALRKWPDCPVAFSISREQDGFLLLAPNDAIGVSLRTMFAPIRLAQAA